MKIYRNLGVLLLFILSFGLAQESLNFRWQIVDIDNLLPLVDGDKIPAKGCSDDTKEDGLIFAVMGHLQDEVAPGISSPTIIQVSVLINGELVLDREYEPDDFLDPKDYLRKRLQSDELDLVLELELDDFHYIDNEQVTIEVIVVEDELAQATYTNKVTIEPEYICGCSWTLKTDFGQFEGNVADFSLIDPENLQIYMTSDSSPVRAELRTDSFPTIGNQQVDLTVFLNEDIIGYPTATEELESAFESGCVFYGCEMQGQQPVANFTEIETKNYTEEDHFRMLTANIEKRAKNDYLVATVTGNLFLLEKLKNAKYAPDFKTETQNTISVHPFTLDFLARAGRPFGNSEARAFHACLP